MILYDKRSETAFPAHLNPQTHKAREIRFALSSLFMAYCGLMTFRPGTQSKWRLLNVATSLPRSSAVAATMTS